MILQHGQQGGGKIVVNVIGLMIGIIAVVVVMGVIMALPVMWLWNWLCPTLFGLPSLGFWQAMGLNVLCGILFKGSTSSCNKGT